MASRTEHKTRTGCPIACILDIVGDHWTLLIVRNLMFAGLHEYKDMLAAEEQISTSVLTDRLKKLEQEGLIASVKHPDNDRRKLYYLTPMGKDLIHSLTEMILWSTKYLRQWLRIPKEKEEFIKRNPAGFKKEVLKELKAWEKEYLGK